MFNKTKTMFLKGTLSAGIAFFKSYMVISCNSEQNYKTHSLVCNIIYLMGKLGRDYDYASYKQKNYSPLATTYDNMKLLNAENKFG